MYTAKTRIALTVAGKRVDLMPGDPLPEAAAAADIKQLLRLKAIATTSPLAGEGRGEGEAEESPAAATAPKATAKKGAAK
ncbi:MAG: hypothetical protein FWF20_06970 [Betaproteobacteria bacterium]|nr:hypothetical protein [Betaproteobacteria bacterium]MCL2886510.1 hypothetical protein [Betaproteobacteria bacterium]